MRRFAALSLITFSAIAGWLLLVSEPAADLRVATQSAPPIPAGSDDETLVRPSVDSPQRVQIEAIEGSGESTYAAEAQVSSGTIEALVLDESGTPSSGAKVELRLAHTTHLTAEPRAVATTDADGIARIAAPFWVDCEVRAVTDRATSERVSPVRSGDTITLRLRRTAGMFGRVIGRVDGSPIRDAMLVIVEDGVARMATTDADGGFRFEGVSEDSVRLEVLAAGHDRLRTIVSPSASAPLLLRLDRGLGLDGLVVRAGGSDPVIGARVEAVARRRVGDLRASLVLASTTSDGLGRFRFDGVPEDGYEIVATDGHQRGAREILEEPVGVLRIELPRCRTLRGVVTRDDGTPAKNAYVSLIEASAFDAESRRVRCDENGRFEIGALRDDRAFRAVVTAEDRSPEIVELAIGRDDTAIRLGPKNSLEGVVKTPDGVPIPNAYVEITDSSPSALRAARSRRETHTDSTGSYRFTGIPPVALRIRADAGAGCSSPTDTFVAAGAVVRIDLIADRRERLNGWVLDAAGRPIDGALVRAEPSSDGDAPRTGRSDATGRFDIRGLSRGTWRISIEAAGHARLETITQIPHGEDWVARLGPARQLRGRVISAATKAPVESFSIRVETDGGNEGAAVRKQTFHRGDGAFELTDLPQDDLALTVRADGYSSFGPLAVDSSARAPIVIQLESAAGLRGRLVDERKTPIAGARVFVRPLDEPGAGVRAAFTATDGSFSIAELPFGDAEVGVGHQDAPVAIIATTSLGSGERDIGERVISAPGSLSIKTPEALWTPGSRLVIRGQRSRTKIEFALDHESIHASPLVPDRYVVEIDRPNAPDLKREIDVGADRPANVTFEDPTR